MAVPGDPTPEMPLMAVVGRRRRRRWVRRTMLGVLGLVVLAAGYYTVTVLQVWRTGESDQARPVDAIVVMGAAQYDGVPSHLLAARLDHVVDLWNRDLAPLVVTTGGKRVGDRFTEAQASAEYLVARGVPRNAIVQVEGDTSYAEIERAAVELRDRGLRSVVLVSDPYHSLRIRLVADEQGLAAFVSPTPYSPVHGWREVRMDLKEAAGVAVGRIIGFDRLLRLTG